MSEEPIRLLAKIDEELASLHSIHSTYAKLFLSEESTRKLLHESDPEFFNDLYRVYLDYISVAVSRLLDPPKMKDKKNLSLFTLMTAVAEMHPSKCEKLESRLRKCKKSAYNFTEPRNQLVSHFDYEVNISGGGRCVPSFITSEFDAFYKTISEVLNEVRDVLGLDPRMYQWGVVGHGHGKRLIRRLEIAQEYFANE